MALEVAFQGLPSAPPDLNGLAKTYIKQFALLRLRLLLIFFFFTCSLSFSVVACASVV